MGLTPLSGTRIAAVMAARQARRRVIAGQSGYFSDSM
jgi:hypothetical protein